MRIYTSSEILSKPNVKKAINKVNNRHKSTGDAPNKFGSAGHHIDMRCTLKRYFKSIVVSERELARIAGDVIFLAKYRRIIKGEK